jgi:TPR repeat protein
MRIFQVIVLAVSLLFIPSLSTSADFAKGLEAFNVGEYELALAEWQTLANDGDSDGQFGMGRLYANGFGVDLDDAEALKWYSLAADQGHGKAMCNIAVMHANGWGVSQSDEEAFKWYGLAAEHGDAMAQINLARMLSDGYWDVQDKVQAHKWFSIASELGDTTASADSEDLVKKMSADEIQEANVLATNWMERYRIQLANH